jgi:type IV secretion system protein VirB4
MFSFRQYREPTCRLPDVLPWACLVAPGVVLQKDGLLQKTLAFRGPDLASASESELVSAVARLNNALKRLGTGWALFVEAQRFDASAYPGSVWTHPAAQIVDVERRRRFEGAGAHFESSYYVTFVWRLPSESKGKLTALFYEDPDRHDARALAERDLHAFQKQVAEIVDILRGVFTDVA